MLAVTLAHKNLLLLTFVVILAVIPLFTVADSEFPGADGRAEETILELSPGYQTWVDAVWEPPGGETESLLFALQAALGSGFLGYYFGLRRGEARKKADAKS